MELILYFQVIVTGALSLCLCLHGGFLLAEGANLLSKSGHFAAVFIWIFPGEVREQLDRFYLHWRGDKRNS